MFSLAQALRSWVRIPFKALTFVCIYSAFVLYDLVEAFRRADHPSKESYQMFIGSWNLKSCHCPTMGCRALNNSIIQGLRIWEQFVDLRLCSTYFTPATLFVSNMLFSKWTGFILLFGYTQPVAALLILPWHALSLLNQLCLHQPSGNGIQPQTFPFLWVPGLTPCLSHISSRFIPTQLLLSREYSLAMPFQNAVSSKTELKSKSKSRYDWFSVSQYVLMSSPFWFSWLDVCYCWRLLCLCGASSLTIGRDSCFSILLLLQHGCCINCLATAVVYRVIPRDERAKNTICILVTETAVEAL
jgi:hypothetical protein